MWSPAATHRCCLAGTLTPCEVPHLAESVALADSIVLVRRTWDGESNRLAGCLVFACVME